MEIRVKRFVDAAFERLLHDEVERAQVVDAVAPHRTCEQGREGGLKPFRMGCALTAGSWCLSVTSTQMLEMFALVAGTGVGDLAQGALVMGRPMVMRVATWSRSRRHWTWQGSLAGDGA